MSVLLINSTAASIPLADNSIHMIVTSPPYYGLRDYGLPPSEWPAVTYAPMAGLPPVTVPAMVSCLGLEPDLLAFIGHIVLIFREAWRVLRDDGTIWLNFGDSYAANRSTSSNAPSKKSTLQTNHGQGPKPGDKYHHSHAGKGVKLNHGLKQKDLVGIPWRVAFALQADGWYLRSDIIWAKPNPMPESVTDRPTKAHEYLFLLSKNQRYFYDHEAVKETAVADHAPGNQSHKYVAAYGSSGDERHRTKAGLLAYAQRQRSARDSFKRDGSKREQTIPGQSMGTHRPDREESAWDITKRNRRTVWTISTKPYSGAHFAVFPPDLVEPCIKAGTSECGVCPACGAPWQRETEKSAPQMRPDNPNPVLPYDAGSGLTQGMGATTLHMTRTTLTTGWRPSCDCPEHDPRPAVVLDIFAGSGTTLEVARQLGRSAIGTDLSFDYLKNQARKRLSLDALDAHNNGLGITDARDYSDLFTEAAV